MRTAEDNPSPTDLFAGATNLSQPQAWRSARFGASRLLSIAIHGLLVCVALIPWAAGPALRVKPRETSVAIYLPSNQVLKPNMLPSGGGGGGGKNRPRPASRGELPPAADKQFVPPDPEPPKSLDPTLAMIPTIVAPQLPLQLRDLSLLNIGDPNGVVGPPSGGPGRNNGIGAGDDGGVGNRKGPGAGDDPGQGCCGQKTYIVGGNVSAPVIIHRIEPEYSEEARKARYEGAVVLQAIIRRDGSVDAINVVRSLGFGLDQNAIEALKQWRFRPAMMDGMPVDVTLNIEVRFNIR